MRTSKMSLFPGRSKLRLTKIRADILGRAITVYSQDDAEIVAEASREIARLKMENARLIKLLNEMRTNAEELQCSSM